MTGRDLRRMDHLTWPEFQERLNSSVFILPLGATEQHGYHMPLGVDVFLPLHLALRIAEAFPAVVASPLAYGYKSQPKSGGGVLFPGTTSLDGATLTASVRDFVRELSRQGQKSIVILNGHMENSLFASEGVDLALREMPGHDVKVVSINWWEHVGDALLDRLFPEGFPGWEAEHAGLTETAMMLHFLPDLVVTNRLEANEDHKPIPQYAIAPEPPGLVPASGVLHQAHGASAEKGAVLANYLVDQIVQILRTEFPAVARQVSSSDSSITNSSVSRRAWSIKIPSESVQPRVEAPMPAPAGSSSGAHSWVRGPDAGNEIHLIGYCFSCIHVVAAEVLGPGRRWFFAHRHCSTRCRSCAETSDDLRLREDCSLL